ncbi:MAG: hypothetical protein QM820_03325 [Minicystis sp.]
MHLAEQLGTPVLADPLYGKAPRGRLLQELAERIGRQALHARVLGFVHPATGKAARWESALPADMEAVLARLRVAGHDQEVGRPMRARTASATSTGKVRR